jgi:type I restriction enzyme M protein
MRKSLSNKRNEIGDGTGGKPDQIAAITRLYGDFQATETSKLFDNEDFGYWRITVERPLRLNFAFAPERIERFRQTKAFQGLATSRKKGREGEAEITECRTLQAAILTRLEATDCVRIYKNRDEFRKAVDKLFKGAVKLPAPLLKALLDALSERDETADVCTDARGNLEPDPDLRDNENVPLKEDIHAYFRREVLPHVPDAWIDEDKTKKGYEIPFTRHFYQYTPLRPLKEIEAEIAALEEEIQGMLGEAMA